MRKYIITLMLGSTLAAYPAFMAGQFMQERATRPIAIEHGCAEYGSRDGNFHWLEVMPTISDAQLQMLPKLEVAKPPKPQRKPEVK